MCSPVLLESTTHLQIPVDYWCFTLMQPRYSFTGVTKDLQDLILSETCLQALVHEVHHLPSWGEKSQEWEQVCQIGSSLVQAPVLPDLLCLRLLTELWLHSQHAIFMSSHSKFVTSFSLAPPPASPQGFWKPASSSCLIFFPLCLNPRGFFTSASRWRILFCLWTTLQQQQVTF